MRRLLGMTLLALFLLIELPVVAQPGEGSVVAIEVQGVINPLTAQYLDRTLRLAGPRAAQVVVLELDTPGGLESAMREMVQALLE